MYTLNQSYLKIKFHYGKNFLRYLIIMRFRNMTVLLYYITINSFNIYRLVLTVRVSSKGIKYVKFPFNSVVLDVVLLK